VDIVNAVEIFWFEYADAMDGTRHETSTLETYVERDLAVDIVRG
jgi:hypothetical protein